MCRYGPGAPYNKLLGRDATRALATMELMQVDLAPMSEADMDAEELKTLRCDMVLCLSTRSSSVPCFDRRAPLYREWEAKYSQKYDVVGTLKPGSALQLQPVAEPGPHQEPEPEPEPEPESELEPQRQLGRAQGPGGAPNAMSAATAAANRDRRVERFESQTILSYYAGKSEVEIVEMYGRSRASAWAPDVSAPAPPTSSRPTPQAAATSSPDLLIANDQTAPTHPPMLRIRGGDLVRVVGFTDAAQHDGRVGVATGRLNESTGRFGIAVPMANGAEGTLMVPPECLHRHAGPSDSNAAEDAVEFLNAGAAALKMAEAAQNRTQRRAWLRRAVMWYKGLGYIMPGHPSQVAGFKRCEALAFLMNPQ